MNRQSIRVPVVIGPNRLKGASTGPLIDNDNGALRMLREELAIAAKAEKFEPTTEWLGKTVLELLQLYEKAREQWLGDSQDTVGFVYEFCLPTGVSVLMADPRVLAKIPIQTSPSVH